MALPSDLEAQALTLAGISLDVTAITASIAALPPAPTTDDLASIMHDLSAATQTLSDTVHAMLATLKSVRINQQ